MDPLLLARGAYNLRNWYFKEKVGSSSSGAQNPGKLGKKGVNALQRATKQTTKAFRSSSLRYRWPMQCYFYDIIIICIHSSGTYFLFSHHETSSFWIGSIISLEAHTSAHLSSSKHDPRYYNPLNSCLQWFGGFVRHGKLFAAYDVWNDRHHASLPIFCARLCWNIHELESSIRCSLMSGAFWATF